MVRDSQAHDAWGVLFEVSHKLLDVGPIHLARLAVGQISVHGEHTEVKHLFTFQPRIDVEEDLARLGPTLCRRLGLFFNNGLGVTLRHTSVRPAQQREMIWVTKHEKWAKWLCPEACLGNENGSKRPESVEILKGSKPYALQGHTWLKLGQMGSGGAGHCSQAGEGDRLPVDSMPKSLPSASEEDEVDDTTLARPRF